MNGWRPMKEADIAAVSTISDAVHGAYTEGAPIYAERLRLDPAGCWLLAHDGTAMGYCISHPWQGDAPPPLDALLQAIPTQPDRYYLHDLALLPQARGTGAAADAVELVLTQARRAGFKRIALTAVNGAEAFWRKHGFAPSRKRDAAYGIGSIMMDRPTAKSP
ncbi:GNAT family N-acetyltransferase [Sphingobium sp. HWE2-09]|uniref:GNAT family N-acetyltransferase n=1 Tax=Sphingobium sp. HWE2-09 TaxID=3108390 RepID=UPI002DD16286|nr:GNAT family N-acetyltransferase [Sphingobium sp. HWE2-09]